MTLDIHSRAPYPSNVLSNFYNHQFKIKVDGEIITIGSMESFMQVIKIEDVDLQKRVFSMSSIEARQYRTKIKNNTIWFLGKPVSRFSSNYEKIVKRAFEIMAKQNPYFIKALLDTKSLRLTHSIGKQSKDETILTEQEFVKILMWLRDKYGSN